MKKLLFMTVCALLFSAAGCGKQALFDMLSDNSISVVVKGTYESNAPRPWITGSAAVVNDDSMTACPPDGGVASSTKPSGYDSFPSTFKIDIAEIKIDNDRFANHRTLYLNATDDSAPLFDGTGLPFRNDDVTPNKTYSSLNVYLRKVVFTNGFSFNASTGAYISTLQSYFDEVKSDGYDFNPLQMNSIYDTQKNNSTYINRVFPLVAPFVGGFVYDKEHEYVIECRILVKNYVKRYEYITTVDDVINAYHFFAFSDKLSDVRSGDTYIGGNMIAGARWYIKGQTVTISGTVPANSYVIAIPANDDITKYQAPTISRPADSYSPRQPSLEGSDDVSYLEYYLDRQKYFYDYYTYVYRAQNNLDDYTTTWDTFGTAVDAYRLPPLATWSGTGTYSLTEVQAGKDYDLYYASSTSIGMGNLPTGYTGKTTVSIPLSSAGTTVTVDLP